MVKIYQTTLDKEKYFKIIDIFPNPENLNELIVTVEYYFNLQKEEHTTVDENGNETTQVTYKAYAARETYKFPIDVDLEAAAQKFQDRWNNYYKKIDATLKKISELKGVEIDSDATLQKLLESLKG